MYQKAIDQKQTIIKMKKILTEFEKRINSMSYDNYLKQTYGQEMVMQEEDSIMDYISYTRSTVAIRNDDVSEDYEKKLIHAITKRDENHRNEAKRRTKWILDNIAKLEDKKKNLLIDKYVYHLKNRQLMEKYDVVESTITRNLNKACLDLAILLEIEVII